MEFGQTLKHLAFFEDLSKADECAPAWHNVSAGLVVMRLVDELIDNGPAALGRDSWTVRPVREAIAEVPDTTPLRRILTSIVDAIEGVATVDIHALIPRLMAYGQALEYEAKFALATDVYETIIAHADPLEDADLVVSAHIQHAFCLRTVGDLDSAAAAYGRASSVALAAGDLIGVLRGRLGDAKIATARGNMPKAEGILDETIARAQSNGLVHVQSLALADRAYVAGLCQQHDRAIRYSYEAMELMASPRMRDRILNNIATGFRFLGLFDAARDAYLVLATTAEEQYVRWLAEVNLMELAAQEGGELTFDKYRRDLESADFAPQLRITYLLHVGRGYHALGRSHMGVPYLERPLEMAVDQGLNQMVFEVESALTSARQRASQPLRRAPEPMVGDVQSVVDAIREMRELAAV